MGIACFRSPVQLDQIIAEFSRQRGSHGAIDANTLRSAKDLEQLVTELLSPMLKNAADRLQSHDIRAEVTDTFEPVPGGQRSFTHGTVLRISRQDITSTLTFSGNASRGEFSVREIIVGQCGETLICAVVDLTPERIKIIVNEFAEKALLRQ